MSMFKKYMQIVESNEESNTYLDKYINDINISNQKSIEDFKELNKKEFYNQVQKVENLLVKYNVFPDSSQRYFHWGHDSDMNYNDNQIESFLNEINPKIENLLEVENIPSILSGKHFSANDLKKIIEIKGNPVTNVYMDEKLKQIYSLKEFIYDYSCLLILGAVIYTSYIIDEKSKSRNEITIPNIKNKFEKYKDESLFKKLKEIIM